MPITPRKIIRKIRNLFIRIIESAEYAAGKNMSSREIQAELEFLRLEVSRLSSIVRYLSEEKIQEMPIAKQTQESFDFQWGQIPLGRYSLENEQFRNEAADFVCEFTALPPDWFNGKSVLDVGCGAGRYSWAMSSLGANVLSIDQSDYGLEKTAEVCSSFPNHRIKKVNLLEDIEINEQFDLVWSFGVLHHTGCTYGAFQKIVPLVKSQGFLFLMLYGEPRDGMVDDFRAVNEYERWRRQTRNLTLDQKLRVIETAMDDEKFMAKGEEHIEGYFDAISPMIADLYSWSEIESWLLSSGFENIQRTVDTRNHHVVCVKS